LDKNPKTRLGVIDKSEIKKHPFFKGINWDDVLNKKLEPPTSEGFSDEEDSSERIQFKN
jgi:hypothetical protein